MAQEQQQAKIVNISDIALGTVEVTIKAPSEFYFLPGQYITITIIELSQEPLKEQFRDFSIASAPNELPLLRVAFRQSNSNFKKILSALPIGSKVMLDGPAGVFTLPEPPATVALIAGGIGITPFMSTLRATNNYSRLRLIYFNHSSDRATFLSELMQLPNLKLTTHFGLPKKEHFSEYAVVDISTHFYIAGPPKVVKIIRDILTELKVKDEQIRTEEFSGYDETS